jgi:hypothetical protein
MQGRSRNTARSNITTQDTNNPEGLLVLHEAMASTGGGLLAHEEDVQRMVGPAWPPYPPLPPYTLATPPLPRSLGCCYRIHICYGNHWSCVFSCFQPCCPCYLLNPPPGAAGDTTLVGDLPAQAQDDNSLRADWKDISVGAHQLVLLAVDEELVGDARNRMAIWQEKVMVLVNRGPVVVSSRRGGVCFNTTRQKQGTAGCTGAKWGGATPMAVNPWRANDVSAASTSCPYTFKRCASQLCCRVHHAWCCRSSCT